MEQSKSKFLSRRCTVVDVVMLRKNSLQLCFFFVINGVA